ncbi:pyruvate dehydrogenase (acetyl-transferring) E1 component, alpha subunit [Acidimicrobium ferrooxidans DSM 10331]|uniref:Pyruvate dehydrogenase (Acetyl-transferring) E1 component, alpha subunit n=1 Tax=Acidimicrobium ferrooxidans (strain DSM 10331 / JCM 15462 / NBRC 103882 / ICP) TaxID=525909 RepID=C7LYG1_ACIFD|nr:pyruvate dehydrogenase (acetyl-transferring) E1 component subunit alpha [Acidimicrobium ferrooxidans]ACU53769.1 pyruvate dehydrogenase (acetyl-transferring) E1 component, alpha subunit [Acidimicrobium ferrooxidans DSM 10331]
MEAGTIEEQFPLLQRLNEDGELVGDLGVVDLDRLAEVYRHMVMLRRFDERAWNLQRQGVIGTYAPYKGQEAAQLGAAHGLAEQDWLVPTYRDWAASWARGVPLEHGLFFAKGHPRMGLVPEEATVLPAQVVIAAQTLHGVGVAWSLKLRHEPKVALVTFGDGAASQGDTHEAMNFASVFRVPLVFFCENNHWAISVPLERQMHSETIAQRAVAYGMEGFRVDGNDYVAVVNLVHDLAERARQGEGPFLVEAVTYRLGAHTTADDPSKYRESAEEERWEAKDPIRRIERLLQREGRLDDDAIAAAEASAAEAVEGVLERFHSALDDEPATLFDHVYAELTPQLAAQRDRFVARVKEVER